jgi:protoporphyrinogen/coproporphyrinogen III oxidase
MSEKRQAIVIGAGITGLVTAYELQKRGLSVSLLERADTVGGVIQSERRDDYLLERGPSSFLESEEALQLIEELGLESSFVAADPKAPRFIYFGSKLEQVPMSPLAFLTTSLLSVKGKLRIFAEPFIPPRRGEGDESIADFVRRRIGKEGHDRLLAPFVSGVYAGNTEALSMAASFPKMVELESKYGSLVLGAIRSARQKRLEESEKKGSVKRFPGGKRLCSFLDGMATLPGALARKLDDSLMTSCKSIDITIGSDSPRYRVRVNQLSENRELSTDTLVLATPATPTAKIIGHKFPSLATELESIEYAPMGIVYLSFDKLEIGRSLDGFGFLVPRNQGVRILGCVWNSSLFPARSPLDRALVTSFIGGAHDRGAVDLTDEELIKIVGGELKSILRTPATPAPVGVWRVRQAIPQYMIGHVARVARIREIEKAQPGLHFAGNYMQGVSVPDCISRAMKLASHIAK